jgi:hypothetical protein
MDIKLKYQSLTKSYGGLGIHSSLLCTVHCLSAPLIFTAVSCREVCCETTPQWFRLVDFLFILLAGVAVYFSIKNTVVKWIKVSFYVSLVALIILVVNKNIQIINIHPNLIYGVYAMLILLHINNFYQCRIRKSNNCSVCQNK